jgi:positive regulator of sigma E activity
VGVWVDAPKARVFTHKKEEKGVLRCAIIFYLCFLFLAIVGKYMKNVVFLCEKSPF